VIRARWSQIREVYDRVISSGDATRRSAVICAPGIAAYLTVRWGRIIALGGNSEPGASGTERSARDAGHGPVLDASPNAIVAIDSSGRISYTNPNAELTFGYPRSELLGQPIELLLPDRVSDRHVAHRDGFIANPLARPMGIGLDLSGRRKNGTEFPVEISLSPVETSDGIQVFATVVDITARKAADVALAESERRLRVALEASPNVIIAVDERGDITYANPRTEAAFGYIRAELLGRPIELLLPDRLGERHVAHRDGFLAHPLARPMGIGLDLSGRRKDGTEFPVEISLSPVETADGVQVFATVVDITARKGAESQLLQAQKLESLGRLAGGIAHDFNNMLFAIRGYAELLTDDLSTDSRPLDLEGSRRSVGAIQQAAERATTLTSQLLAFSRQQVVSPRVLDINVAVRSVEPMVHRLIGENLNLTMRLDEGAGHVRTDPGQLDQILVNLVVNARDAMPNGGTVTIETGNTFFDEPYADEHFEVTPGPYVMLAVTDTGMGMDRATREHIFEPFFTTKDLGKGTGLGLATIYGIVRQAGGHIWLYSEPGLGTSFKLYFPSVNDPISAEPAAAPASPGVGVGTILVVEDEPAVRDMTTQLLQRAGYRVFAVADGAEAIALVAASSNTIDVLVTDVIMPNMSGIALAEHMMDRYPDMGAVLLSGYTAETLDLERAMARGAMFISKPITSGQLLIAVQRAGASRRSVSRQH
jgi:PAS domain S-box-containing protein